MEQLREGTPCPAFELPDADGATVSLDDLKGRPFVLYFYPKDDTSGCTVEAKDFSQAGEEFAAIGVPVFGVSPDGVKSHAKFAAKHELSVRLLADEEKKLISALGLWVEKSMYGRTYMGVERATILFDAQARAHRVWPKVKVKGHVDEVLAAAKALAAG